MSEAIAQKLDEARALIEKGWCRHALARDGNGSICHEGEDVAACWCSAGAIFRTDDIFHSNSAQMCDFFERVIGGNIADWNDAPERTQAEVIEAFRKAAELARASMSHGEKQ